ncbi:DUF4097 family beta strand repeat-containing protein [Listeria cossartiae subsp. cayugensis]|uniref:DUF4097 domain-containing protein n=1 Tax=Listeria cossartiae subsp. cayugensis TaxID=2713505 RepID=A0A7X0ZE87_9LIST|nr:DUF4097 family beta strand repeat-containing protein [Listeria cossartiae]MBC1807380.1 DUF4097 domain-containing protein [Listeria cossartiae subsp. cayugensis]MBC2250839.1 DUF4097 domain-containing protein [Listeria cossartiae subsp. cayugensis]MDT0004390.1 DUF4097 family beta strand repeat-containing protein [Listeria cossartiae subsp. cayugensis]MDT0015362.1 DUF4097 family beta strand repeat-containing protein [Listeria cossartiae subsp. cayugensis]MDT0020769.1 DUF4097 family beta strand
MENERKRILELVKQGIISTEEALTLLENISKKEGKTAAKENIRRSAAPKEEKFEEQEEPAYDYSKGWNNEGNPYTAPKSRKRRPEPNPENHERYEDESENTSKDREESMRNMVNDLSQAGEKIGSFLNNAFKQVKDMPFPFLTSTKIERDFVYHDTTLSILEFEIANGNIEFKPSDSNDIKVHAMIKLFKEYPEDEALKIFFDKTTLRVDEETLRFESTSKQIVTNLTVYLPRREYDYVSVKMLNGNFHLDELSGRDLFVKTTNGNISLGTLNATLAEIESINGNVRIQNGEIRDVALKTFNGNVAAKGNYYSTNLQTKNGNVNYQLTGNEATFLKAKTGAGNIEVIVPAAIGVDGRFHTNLGKLLLDLKDAEILESKTESVSKSIIFTKLPDAADSSLKIEAEATTGSVKIRDVK